MANMIVKEKSKVGGLTLPEFKTYSKATALKVEWHRQKNRQMDPWSRTESRE